MSSLQNIRNNFTRGIECRLLNDKYYDYMLYKGGVAPITSKIDCMAVWIDMNNKESYLPYDGIVSVTEWGRAKASDFSLKHIGFTGIDNGLVQYEKEKITQDEFNELFISSEMVFTKDDRTLALYPVSGNTGKYSYAYSFTSDNNDSYVKLNGGFFQGVFKVPDEEYEILPAYIDEDWHFEFVLRPQSGYTESGITLNSEHENNKGMFFFIGTRAENKFSIMSDGEKNIEYDGEILNIADGIDDIEIKTDNKHIFYNRTRTGSTTHNPVGIDKDGFRTVVFKKKREYKDNAFKLFNRTKDGYTADDVKNGRADDIYKDSGSTYDIANDVAGNAFALKYNEDGSISYRYMMKEGCGSASGWSLQEETTGPNLVKDGEWNVINVRFSVLNHAKDKFGVPVNLGNRKMKIMIYVNGYLVFISKELDEFAFRALDVKPKFQECVPFNISLGGGTQGLSEMATPKYNELPKERYPLENAYAGTFIGDIRAFKMYTCFMQYEEIKNNFILEVNPSQREPSGDMIKDNIIYYGFNTRVEDVPINGKKMNANNDFRGVYMDIAKEGNSKFYVIMSKQYVGSKPFQFTCGGSPMVMLKNIVTIGGEKCIIYESGETYASGTELLIISDNF